MLTIINIETSIRNFTCIGIFKKFKDVKCTEIFEIVNTELSEHLQNKFKVHGWAHVTDQYLKHGKYRIYINGVYYFGRYAQLARLARSCKSLSKIERNIPPKINRHASIKYR